MSANDDQIEHVEISIEQARAKVAKLDALNRLANNKDFMLVVEDGYFKEKAAEIVLAKAMPEMDAPEKQASCIKTIDAIGELRQYFLAITQMGQRARQDLEADEQTRSELLSEGLDDVG